MKVVLWQSDENTVNDFNWVSLIVMFALLSANLIFSQLKKTHLTVERDLRKPDQVVVNGKVLKVNAFHHAVSDFGYITIDGFHLHRLLKSEINQISFFSGENLWNLITALFNSKDLIEVINFKEVRGTFYQKALT